MQCQHKCCVYCKSKVLSFVYFFVLSQIIVTFHCNLHGMTLTIIHIFPGAKRVSTKHDLSILLANRALGTLVCPERQLQFSQSILYVSTLHLKGIDSITEAIYQFLNFPFLFTRISQSKLFGSTGSIVSRNTNISEAAEMQLDTWLQMVDCVIY